MIVLLVLAAMTGWWAFQPPARGPEPEKTPVEGFPERGIRASKADLEVVALGSYPEKKLLEAVGFLATETRLMVVAGPVLEIPPGAFVGSRTAYRSDLLIEYLQRYKGRPSVLALTRRDLVNSDSFDDPPRVEARGEGVAILSDFRIDLRADGRNDSRLTRPRTELMLLRLEGFLWGREESSDPASLYYGGLVNPWDIDKMRIE